MSQPRELDFWEHAGEVLNRLRHGGVVATVVDKQGACNAITLGWGQVGPVYHEHPVFIIAVCPPRYSWRFLEAVPEFVVCVPDDSLAAAVELCGTRSGRDMDKFKTAGLTRVPSVHVRAPSIREFPLNIECRIYTRIHPPHTLLTPEHRKQPVEKQHTIYFSEVLGTYTWKA